MTLEKLRQSLAKPKTSIQLCIMGMIAGLIAGTLIILFRLVILYSQELFLHEPDNFTSLPEIERLFLPMLGALFIAIFADMTGFKHYRLGIPFVIHRIKTKYGHMPIWNTANQFVGGALALISGFSVGREGPSVHMGATGASLLANWLRLPHNSMRTLVGCGVAAGIAASFNTPLAAVIFVMEVVLREYKIHIFVPIMVAAVVGTLLTRAVFGDVSELALISVEPISGWHYPYLVLCGVVLGAVAYLFNRNLMLIIKTFKPINMFPRLLLAGLIAGVIAYFVPQAMGSGMGAIQFAISPGENVQLLLLILAAKFVATLFAIGLGIPGGLIGPIIGLGVLIGTIMAMLAGIIIPGENVSGTYAVLGMAGLLAATLHAPLAALVAVMELTSSPEIIMPAMLVICAAYVTALQVFGNRSIFLQQLDFQGLDFRMSPAKEALQKIGAINEMDTEFKLLFTDNTARIRATLDNLDEQIPLIIRNKDKEFKFAEYDLNLVAGSETPIKYISIQGISDQATLADAFDVLKDKRSGAVYVFDSKTQHVMGLIRWSQLHHILTMRNA